MNQTISDCFVTLTFVVICLFVFGCNLSENAATASTRQMVYLCTETSQTVVASQQQTPAVNPATGRRTLMPALYCRKCKTWYPAPPLELLQRTPRAAVCPKTGAPLTTDGPLPE